MSMQSSPEHEAWLAACREERKAWEKVKDQGPGSPSYDPVLWGRWQEALRKAAEAARRMDKSRYGPQRK
jgi:hypothetical protein